MRVIILLMLLFISGGVCAQAAPTLQDTTTLKNTIMAMDLALMRKDTILLKIVLHDDLVYGHSNGWRESKRDIVNHLYDGTITYKYINEYEPDIVFAGDVACVRTNPDINVVMDGKLIELKLHVLMVWLKTDKGWRLLSRQSIRI